MSRYIDADAFEREVMFSDDEDIQDVIYRLRDFPTADVVDVVRCRDCKHLKMKIGWGECEIYRWSIPYEDHYCGYGERRKQ